MTFAVQVTRRKVSAGNTDADIGRDCRDAFLSLAKTCDKLGIADLGLSGQQVQSRGAPDHCTARPLRPEHASAPVDGRKSQHFVAWLLAFSGSTRHPRARGFAPLPNANSGRLWCRRDAMRVANHFRQLRRARAPFGSGEPGAMSWRLRSERTFGTPAGIVRPSSPALPRPAVAAIITWHSSIPRASYAHGLWQGATRADPVRLLCRQRQVARTSW